MSHSRKHSKKDDELYQRVDEVLHYLWDPIGVSDAPAARDEYYSYLPHVFSLLQQGADRVKIANHLGNLTSVSMAMGINKKRDLEIADILLVWKETIWN